MAKYLHAQVARASHAFISINCAAIPENLLESELFGHEKGAFTGAVARRIGKFEEANGGTLLLDEISEMDIRLQAKLLRAIQERLIDRVGGTSPVPVDIRILATSNRNLAEAVREGSFREDLLFRLNVVNLKLPALRERPATSRRWPSTSSTNTPRPTACRRAPLTAGGAPGAAPRALARQRPRAREHAAPRRAARRAATHRPRGDRHARRHRPQRSRPHRTLASAGRAGRRQRRPRLVGRTVADVERDLILDTLDHVLGNRTHAANILGISIRTLRNKLNQYADEGLAVPAPGEQRKSA